jgi:CheY-like chemotaxis protein
VSTGELMADARATVLVIDDEADLREMLAFNLSGEGFEVETVSCGEDAVQAARQRRFDLAITDINMPGMGGVATVAALKAIDADLEIIVGTGYASVDTAVACMKHGAFDYVSKPYDLPELRLLVDRALERRRLQGAVALYRASQRLLGTLRREELVPLVMELGRGALAADAVGLVLAEDAPAALSVAWNGPGAPPQPLLSALAAVVQSSHAPWRAPSAGSQWPTPGVDPAGWGSALVYALHVQDHFLGALVLLRRQGSAAFAAPDEARGAPLGAQAALALYNARLYGALEETLQTLMRTREQLVLNEKMALAGKLAGGVAHEINSPLAAARVNVTLLREQAVLSAQDPDTLQILDDVKESIDRIADLVRDFRMLGELSTPGQTEALDLDALVEECVELVEADGGLGDALAVSPRPPTRLHARGVPEDVVRAVRNVLAFLAVRAAARPAPLHVEIGVLVGADGPTIAVADRALSLGADERAALFDPRLEADARHGGRLKLDVGLTLAQQLLHRSGGRLHVEALPGGGTNFRAVLSAA